MYKLTRLLIVLAAFSWPLCVRADFTYPDFASVSGLQLNGSAAQAGNVLRLTPAQRNEGGSVFTQQQISLGNLNSFSTYFQFQMTNPGGISDSDGVGADGIAFVIQTNANNVGADGGGIGFRGITPSLGIEFDTYKNSWDPNGNHVGIDLNGDLTSLVTANEPTRFNNGQVWNVWIDYDGTSNQLEVRWSMGTVKPAASQLSATVSLPQIFGQGTGFVGFTAGTASAWENQDILHWEYRDGFVASEAPVITSPGTAAGEAGLPFTYQITATNAATGFAVADLPAGLSLDPTTGIIYGVPTAAGTVNLAVSATGPAGTGTGSLVLTVQPANPAIPTISSQTAATARSGLSFVYQIVAAGSPTFFGAAGLPDGLGVDAGTGLISGIPTSSGTFDVTISAGNAAGTVFYNLVLIIIAQDAAFPSITSPATASGVTGGAFTYRITATNSPTTFHASGLPDGLTLDPIHGMITGRATTIGTYPIIVSAANTSGADVLVLVVVIEDSVTAAPVITSAPSASAQTGLPFSYTTIALNTAASYTATGLPAGLGINPFSGLIAGTPTQAGTFTVNIVATNSHGNGTLTLTLTVAVGTPMLTLSATTPLVVAGGDGIGEFTLRLAEPLDHDIVVNFLIKGTAVNGSDYVLIKTTKKIKAGKVSKPVKIVPVGPGAGPGVKRVVVLVLQPGDGYTVGTAGKVRVKIAGE